LSAVEQKRFVLFLIGFLVLELVGAAYYGTYFYYEGYLPSPFLYVKSDTFADFFNVMYWSDDPRRYTEWNSVYPPVNFLFMKCIGWLFLGGGQLVGSTEIRDRSLGLQFFIVFFYFFLPLVTMNFSVWKSYSNKERILIYATWILSAPLLFGLERGNLIIFCVPFVAVALFNEKYRPLAIAILINIKPYFAIFIFSAIVTACWSEAIIIIMLAGAIFVFTGLLTDPDFLFFLPNILSYGQSDSLFSGREVLALPSSVSALSVGLNILYNEGMRGAFDLTFLSKVISVVNYIFVFSGIFILFFAGKKISQGKIMAVLLVIITNLGIWVGGYSMIFYPILIPILMTFRSRWICLFLMFSIFVPLDMVVLFRDNLPVQARYLSGTVGAVEYQFGLGSILRPFFNLTLLGILILDIFSQLSRKESYVQDYQNPSLKKAFIE
jgi:hypothetical protein